MTNFIITGEQLAAVRTQRKQLLDSPHKNDHAAAALLNWVETLQPAPATSLSGNKTLASDHQGMRVNYSGLLGQCQRALALGEGSHSALAEMLRQLQGHLQELGRRWYAGDVAVVDELLQLYCVEAEARAALKDAQPAASAPEPSESEARDAAHGWLVGEKTPEVLEILGTMCFECIGFAKVLRLSGEEIPTRAESEQAHTLHYLLSFYASHGDEWREAAIEDIKRRESEHRAAPSQGNAA